MKFQEYVAFERLLGGRRSELDEEVKKKNKKFRDTGKMVEYRKEEPWIDPWTQPLHHFDRWAP